MPTRPSSQPPPRPPATDPRRRGLRAAEHRRRVRRRRRGAFAALVAVAGGVALMIAEAPSASLTGTSRARGSSIRSGAGASHRRKGSSSGIRTGTHRALGGPRPGGPFATGTTVLRFVDHTRSVRLPDGRTVPRTLRTDVFYPARGPLTGHAARDAPAAVTAGPFPLIVFGHGFAVTPSLYARLLRAWAAAGYVVAAPVFPLENADAPGGPNESDLPNQPADMRLVISRMLAVDDASSGLLSGLIARREIAVAGQSDGGDTALAVAYDPRFRDTRVRAAIILSGAEIPGIGGFPIAPGGPPLLATQGTSDTINPPGATDAYYDPAPAPKYLLGLRGASHLPPYSSDAIQLGVVKRVTIAFLDHYLKRIPGSLHRMLTDGRVPGVATLDADP